METKEKLIQHLKIENDELKEIVFKSFDTMEELREYKKTNKQTFDKYFSNLDRIRQLEWELMTPEQQARAKEVAYLVKLKTGQIKEGEE